MRRQRSYIHFHDTASSRSAVTDLNTETTSVLFSWLKSSDASVHVDFESFDSENPMKNQKTCIWILYAPVWTKVVIVISFFLLTFSAVFLIVIHIMGGFVAPITTKRTNIGALSTEMMSVSPSLSVTINPSNSSPYPSFFRSKQPSLNPSIQGTLIPTHDTKSNVPTNEASLFPSLRPSNLRITSFPSHKPSKQSVQIPSCHPSQDPSINSLSESRTSFYLMADRYRPNQHPELIDEMSHIPTDADFVIHLGDFNNLAKGCNDTSYREFRDMIVQNMPIPTFVTPGDNELNDCPNPTEAWENWNSYILNIDSHWVDFSNDVTRQEGNEENFAFHLRSVLYIGLNMVGGKVLDRTKWKNQMENNIKWIVDQISTHEELGVDALVIFGHASDSSRYEFFFQKLVEEVKKNGVPTLYIHESNEHFEVTNHAFNTSNFWTASIRGGFLPFPNVIVDIEKSDPFTFEFNAF